MSKKISRLRRLRTFSEPPKTLFNEQFPRLGGSEWPSDPWLRSLLTFNEHQVTRVPTNRVEQAWALGQSRFVRARLRRDPRAGATRAVWEVAVKAESVGQCALLSVRWLTWSVPIQLPPRMNTSIDIDQKAWPRIVAATTGHSSAMHAADVQSLTHTHTHTHV